MAWLDRSQGMDSFLLAMEGLGRSAGEMSGRFEFAEGWRRRLHYGFCDEDAAPLEDALRERLQVPRMTPACVAPPGRLKSRCSRG